VRKAAAAIVVSLLALLGSRPTAQGLTVSLFERYLDSLRLQAGIPGLSAVIVQDGAVAWERGFGRADLDRPFEPSSLTPYQIGGLSQTLGASLLLKKCVEQRGARPIDAVELWHPFFQDPTATLGHLLAHVSSTGIFKYDLARVSALTPVIEACSGIPYPRLLADELFGALGLNDSVPGTALGAPTAADVEEFGIDRLARYSATLARMARGYRVDTRGRATRTDVPLSRVNAAGGVVTTARDLARFDAAFRVTTPVNPLDKTVPFVAPETVTMAWSPVGLGFPTGLGWFVQGYNGHLVVWQFGVVPDAYSALVVKLPLRGLTLILLANSDALGVQGMLERGDVNASVFARAFLRTYVP
jgi:CubicO group peptidase (beta-lactamase class C family)